jgi:N-acetylglucosamine kinase-like BadF-type ATPase
MPRDELVLGIDGGGTKTVAWLAVRSSDREPSVVGRGSAGPANPQAVGFEKAVGNLNLAVDGAFGEAGVRPAEVTAAVLGLAGSDRDENRQVLERWAGGRRLAGRFRVVNDALPVLAAGSPEGWGVALISGTGSFAFGQDRGGRSTRAGGWGFLFGDEGSGYAIALAGLQAAAKSADGRGPATQLLEAVLSRLELEKPQDLISAVYPLAADRAAIASLAGLVTGTADAGDAAARQILDEAAAELAATVAAVARNLGFSRGPFPLALSGGVLLGSESLRERLCAEIRSIGLEPDPTACVQEPVLGAVKLAGAAAAKSKPEA